MKKRGLVCLLLCALLLLCGCAKEQEAAVPPPDYPLDEQTVYSAFEDAGFSVILSEEDTDVQPDRVRVTLRDPEKTYTEGGGHVLVASVLTANTEQGRAMMLSYWGDEKAAPAANLDDWKKQLSLAERLYGLKTGVLYGAFSGMALDGENIQLEAAVDGGYCRVTYWKEKAWLNVYLTPSREATALLLDAPRCQVVLRFFWTTDDKGRYTTIFQPYMEACAGKDNYEQARSAYYEDSYLAYYDGYSNYVTQDCIETWMANREPFKYDKLALENDCRITPGEAKFTIYKLYDDAVTFSFELPLTIARDSGGSSEQTLTGQVQLDLVQNQVSKITYDAFSLPMGQDAQAGEETE